MGSSAGVANGEPTPDISNGQSYTVTTTVIEGGTPDNLGHWKAEVGQIAGGDPAVVEAFNTASHTSASEQIDDVRTGWTDTTWNFESSGHVTIRNSAIAQLIGGTIYCCAHPTNFTSTIVIDSRTAQPITLADLFANEQDGLNRLSEQAKIIVPRDFGMLDPTPDNPGFAPRQQNFANWIPAADGMEIHFDEYQFGARLPVTITVPWSALTDVLAPDMAVLTRA